MKQVGIHDNFFHIGGDSLRSLQVIAQAQRAGLSLTPWQLFEHPTIAELAAVAGTPCTAQTQQGPVTGPVLMAPSPRWFFESETDPRYSHMMRLLEMPPELNPAFTDRAVSALMVHHDALRSRFVRQAAGWQQIIAEPNEPTPFTSIDLSALPLSEHTTLIRAIAHDLQERVNVTTGPPLRIILFQRGVGQTTCLLIVAHHLVFDLISLDILEKDFQLAYQELCYGEQVQLPPKTTSLQEWGECLKTFGASAEMRQAVAEWFNLPWNQTGALPLDYPEGKNTATLATVDYVEAALEANETNLLLKRLSTSGQVQILDVLLMAVVQAVTQWTGRRYQMVYVLDHGRNMLPTLCDLDISRTIGWLVTSRFLLLERVAAAQPREALQAFQAQLSRMPLRGFVHALIDYYPDAQAVARAKTLITRDKLVQLHYLGELTNEANESGHLGKLIRMGLPLNSGSQVAPPVFLRCRVRIVGERLIASWEYSTARHRRSTVEQVADAFIETLRALVADVSAQGQSDCD